jgi:Tol biopolymer transport system component
VCLIGLTVWLVNPTMSKAQTTPRPDGPPIRIAGGGDTEFMNPRWSPSGRHIAYTSASYKGLWVSSPNGENANHLTDDSAAGFGYSWSADGTSIVARIARYEAVRRLNAIKVFTTAPDAEEIILDFTTDYIGVPAWLSNDAQVAVVHDDQLAVLGVTNRSSKASITPEPLVMAEKERIVQTNAASGVMSTIKEEDGFVLNLVNSPDGSKVAFEIMAGNLFAMNADGGDRVDLGRGNRPQWSPDGNWIVFQRSEDDGHEFTSSDLYAVRSDGSNVVRLTTSSEALEMNPSWSPDGRFIAFDDRGAIYLLPVTQD